MTNFELLNLVLIEIPRLERLALEAVAPLDEGEFNRSIEGEWSPAQVIQHLALTHGPYIEAMERTAASAPLSSDKPVVHTWIGKIELKMVGPRGNSPVPRKLRPSGGPFDKSALDAWKRLNERILKIADAARGKDLAAARHRNPFVKVIVLNLADDFAILMAHTDRHVRQIVDRSAKIQADQG